MHQLLDLLINDHQNMGKIHAIIIREMEAYKSGDRRPNFALLLDAMDYLRHCPERYHHPIEDLIYSLIRAAVVDPFLSGMLDHIEMQHAQLAVLSRRLHGDYFSIVNDQAVPRRSLISDYEVFIEISQEHILCENKYLFPAIADYLSDERLDEIAQEFSIKNDPAFTDTQFQIYKHLYSEIFDSKAEVAYQKHHYVAFRRRHFLCDAPQINALSFGV